MLSRGVLALLLSACATTATVTTDRGSIEATLSGGDETFVLLTSEVGNKRKVLREEIIEVDHPGNVLALIGGLVGGLFTLETTAFAASGLCGSSGGAGPVPCVFAGGLAVGGVAMFAFGLWTWITSRNAVTNIWLPPGEDLSKVRPAFPSQPNAPPGPSVPPPPPPQYAPPPAL